MNINNSKSDFNEDVDNLLSKLNDKPHPLQLLINKWESDANSITDRQGLGIIYAHLPIASEYRTMRKCINEAKMVLGKNEAV